MQSSRGNIHDGVTSLDILFFQLHHQQALQMDAIKTSSQSQVVSRQPTDVDCSSNGFCYSCPVSTFQEVVNLDIIK
jgi:hypothetical protein